MEVKGVLNGKGIRVLETEKTEEEQIKNCCLMDGMAEE